MTGSLAAGTTLFAGSAILSPAELALYHALNDLRGTFGLAPLKPSADLTLLAGQHAADFEVNVGYAAWAAAPTGSRPVPTLHHWSNGQSFAGGVQAVAEGFGLHLPGHGLSENADGNLAGAELGAVLQAWQANPGTQANMLAGAWNSIGLGIVGSMAYAVFGAYAAAEGTSVPAIMGSEQADRIRATAWADRIDAGAGNDYIAAVGAGDLVDGGAGQDVLVLDQPFTAYAIGMVGAEKPGWLTLQSASGTVEFSNVEYLVFADRVMDSSAWGVPSGNVRFDAAFYLASNPDVAAALARGEITSAIDHFWTFGVREGRAPAGFFDAAYYLSQNPDVQAQIADGRITSAFGHFLIEGQFSGRDPSRYFDTAVYLKNNPDVALALAQGSLASALDHYLSYGRFEGRLTTDKFNETYYLAANPDVAAALAAGAFTSGLEHYQLFGQIEGRPPFDPGLIG